MRKPYWIAALVPAVVGLVLAWLLRRESVPDPLLQLQTEFHLGTLLAAAGLAVSLAWLEGVVIWRIAQDRLERALGERQHLATEARRRFIRRIDHELKNPLTAAYAALENLGVSSDAQERAQAVRDVSAQLGRTHALVRALRQLADLELRPIERVPVDVSRLLAEVREAGEAVGDGPGCCLLSQAGPGPWLVEGDRDQLWMLFYNLLDNALKFAGDSGPIDIELSGADGWLRVSVTDQGPGICPADLPHVFEELYRGESAVGVPGSGIGLALVHSVAERHGGSVVVKSQVGRGASFVVTIPRQAGAVR